MFAGFGGNTIVMSNPKAPRKHHYVPQFYLRNFCCHDDENKVPSLSRNNPFLIKKRNSIGNIGYEDYLYKISDKDIEICIEKHLNADTETPFSQSLTWRKVSDNTPELLTKNDKFILYIFIRHLESRNIETLEFLRIEQQRVNDPKYINEYSESERRMHTELGLLPNGVENFYLGMSGGVEQYFEAFEKVSISVLGSKIPLRTSTNPVVNVPINTFKNEVFDPNRTTKWFPMTPYVGVMLHMNPDYCDFSGYQVVENNVIRTLNRLYLVQLLESKTTRHMIASDDYLEDDLRWAGVQIDSKNPRKFRCPT